MNRHQRRAAGKGGKTASAAPGAAAFAANALFGLAVEHHQAGRLREAEQLYRDILATQPKHTAALSHLGILCFQTGQTDSALALLKRAVAQEPDNPVNHFNLGLVCSVIGRDREAILHNREAIARRPDYADAHVNLGGLLLRTGDASQAITHLAHALEIDPSSRLAHENYATALLAEGRPAESLQAAIAGLKIAPTVELKSLFTLALSQVASLADIDTAECRATLAQALRECWRRPSDLAEAAFGLIARQPEVATALQHVMSAWPRPLDEAEMFDGEIPPSLAEDELLTTFLRSGPAIGVPAELFLTALRRVLLDRTGTTNDGLLELAAALAEQCFINEYVFAAADEEIAKAHALAESIDRALATGQPAAPYDIAVSACYAPLHRLANNAHLIDDAAPASLRRVVAQHVSEVLEEQSIRSSIERLTEIQDETSREVRAQYEANPYPRWTGTPTAVKPQPIGEYLRERFPATNTSALGTGPISLLIAGCGTGRQTINSILLFEPAETLAIDLSLASLAYAIRKTRGFALKNVRYAQADILKLRSLGRTFDVVDASGVLHHLRDPLEGWRTLLEMLRPGGAMRIALYSRRARTAVQTAKARATELGLARDENAIRDFRHGAIAAPNDAPLRAITKYQDFFSLSECRDLVFHVMDHEFGLPDIAEFLAASGLAFLGFETTARTSYLKRFPKDPAAADLGNWHQFEIENPATFAGMYQFWVQKVA